LRYSIRSFIWDLSVLVIYAFMAIHFLFRTAFAVSYSSSRLCCHFH
jgi:hypothetical protein